MNIKFLTIKEIDHCFKDFDNKIFLTFDIDWASDEVLQFNLDLIEKNNLKATFFVTHNTPLLNKMRENPNIELGIHPNFNFLLNGDFRYGKTYDEVVDYYLKIVPEAVSARSHSLVQASQILDAFNERGIKYDTNLLIPRSSNIELKPFESWQPGFFRLPYFWEDDTHILANDDDDVNIYLNHKGLKIFDFHPIHLFLNTENLERYNSSRPYLQDYKKLKEFINNDSKGTLNFFKTLINTAQQ